MESYLFGGKEFERLYNCSVYDIDDVPFENRLHPVVGWALMALFVVFEAAYIPCIPAIRAHLNDSASYKFMYFISFCDVICLFVNSFATGLFSLLGTVYCSCPNLMYLVGALGTSLWYCESTAALLLAFNRCVDMWSPKLGDTLFAGRKTWIWLIVPTLYSLAMCWWNIPVLYNGVYGAWLFNPHAGYLDNVNELYENPFHAVHNLAVAAAFPTLYVVFLVLIMLNTTSVPRAVVTAPRWSWQTATFLQVFIISMVNALTASVYAYLQFVRVSEFLKLVAVYGWVFIHGVPGIIFLTMNRTIRVECLRILGLNRFFFKGIGDSTGTGLASESEQARNSQVQNDPSLH